MVLQRVRQDPGVGNGSPLRYSCLEKSMGRGAWRAVVHGVSKSQTWLSDWAHTEQCKARAEAGTHLWKWQSRVREARFQNDFITKQEAGYKGARFSNKTCGTQGSLMFWQLATGYCYLNPFQHSHLRSVCASRAEQMKADLKEMPGQAEWPCARFQ